MKKTLTTWDAPSGDPVEGGGSPLAATSAFFHGVIEDWLQDPQTTLVCGRWGDGAVSEIIPGGHARLLPARYPGCFAGVREIRLDDGPHHLHIDLTGAQG